MKELKNLRKLMLENGLLKPDTGMAASLEIIPFGEDLFNPDAGLNQSNQIPVDPKQEGGGCTMCATGCSGGCSGSCQSGCPSACSNGCTACCQL